MILLRYREHESIFLQPPPAGDVDGNRLWCEDAEVFLDDDENAAWEGVWRPARYILASPAMAMLDDPYADEAVRLGHPRRSPGYYDDGGGEGEQD